jgi:hypothetical protein
MSPIVQADIELLAKYPRAIMHLRSQLAAAKLMPVFGAGTSRPIGLPGWEELVSRLATAVGLDDDGTTRWSQTSRVQLVYGRFRSQLIQGMQGQPEALVERRIAAAWRTLVHECLYRDLTDVSQHPYLEHFLGCLLRAPLTVNYNFDDALQELLSCKMPSKRFETIYDPTVQYRQSAAVIYHPNGYLPFKWSRGPSPRLVFLEESFADQLIDAQRGHYAALLSHFSRFTALLIGLSLDDPTLKHLLRQSAQVSPGHVHYHVAFVRDRLPTSERFRAVRDSNFRTYNLVTLFLNEEEIASLGRLLSAEDDDFVSAVDEANVPEAFVYYLSGAVGAGKTTTLGCFKSLRPFDEWPEERPEDLMTAADQLTTDQRLAVDQWIDKQVRRRNVLIADAKRCVMVVDRSPLDPIAFALDDSGARASRLRELFESSIARRPVPGMVIFLKGSPDVMHARTLDRHKNATPQYVERLQEAFSALWSACATGVVSINTTDLTERDVVQRVAQIIHLGEYQTVDLDNLVRRAEGEAAC